MDPHRHYGRTMTSESAGRRKSHDGRIIAPTWGYAKSPGRPEPNFYACSVCGCSFACSGVVLGPLRCWRAGCPGAEKEHRRALKVADVAEDK